MGRPFSNAFFAGEPRASAFLSGDFRDPATREAAARAAASRRAHPAVVEALTAQQRRLPSSAARDANLAALARGDTAVVVTGQQVGLFLGPLYSFYKAASAVATARALEAASGARCIPLFWLQTEDHDHAEIASCRVLGADGAPVALALAPETAAEARVSIAHRRLGTEVTVALEALDEALAGAPHAAAVVASLRAAYEPGRSYAEAFARVLATIFADEGLLILDPRDARIAAAASPIYARALDDAEAIEARLRTRGRELANAGFDEQIPVRDGCALLFFHDGGPAAPRHRLKRAGARWELSGAGRFLDDARVRVALADDPLRGSTSALLRPLVQDALLPTAAYVGGPAEVSYFAQLDPLYDVFALPHPLVVPRARFRVIDAPTRRRLGQLGLTAAEAEGPRAELAARISAAHPTDEPHPAELRARVAREVAPAADQIARALIAADPGAARIAARARRSIDRAFERMIARAERALVTRDVPALARLDKLQRALAPDGVPQERVYAWPSLAARLGIAPFTRMVLEHLARAPFTTTVQELTP
ncbi:MAG TPA: bacillithiol biosynthesis cysteine-adding enzyme BshC [Polyangia bacterium]|nr:bacillithiol biosynthesis cysteine-adding enzyme BshC [Polyangia bacterium]